MIVINDIRGNLESLKESVIKEIEGLYQLETDKSSFLPFGLSARLAVLTSRINREIAVYINRKGIIIDISVGDSKTVSLPGVEGRRDKSRLSGVRCVHTHPNGDGRLSAVDLSSLTTLKLDSMTAIGVKEGNVTEIYAAIPLMDEFMEFNKYEIYGPFYGGDSRMNILLEIVKERDKEAVEPLHSNEDEEERAILVGLESNSGKNISGKSEGERSLDELEELAKTAGAVVLNKVLQRKSVQDSAYYIGKGKVEELNLLRQALNANTLIFDDELSGAQVRNIEEATGTKVIDRTTLILDIFAQRAHSREGKLQVELAQLKYRLPRLIGLGNQLSRLGGGIGTRGPGEKKLEVDRRHIRRRLSFLEGELKEVGRRRGLMREGRRENTVPTIALVGYTNVGKSTLMNRLCNADVLAENKLFATLDPTTRRFVLPGGREALLIDTVGFIRKLPHDLVEAFKSTLEEAVHADILMHVVDASSEEAEVQIAVVNEILRGLGALNKPMILALNKMDMAPEGFRVPTAQEQAKVFEISAATGANLDKLSAGIEEMLPVDEEEITVLAPYNEGWIEPYIYKNGKVSDKEYTESGAKIKAVMKKSQVEKLREFVIG